MLHAVPGALEAVAVGVVVVIVGYLIRFREWTFLIAGYDRTSVVPPEVAADVVGSTVLRIGVVTIAFGVAIAAGGGSRLLEVVFAAVVVVAVARIVYRLHTYTPDEDT